MSDERETIQRNPESVAAWKRECAFLHEQVEKLTDECVVLRASSRSKLETISSLELQVEKLTKERDEYKTNFFELSRAFNNQELQLAALAEQNEKMREALLSANDFIFTLQQDLHSERCTDWYPEGAHNAAESMSESMRLIGNSCADFTDVVEALTIPDLASPVLNRIRAEGMREAEKIVRKRVQWVSNGQGIQYRSTAPESISAESLADEIRARADELEKTND